MLPTHVEQALGELAALGRVTSDGFTGLRALLTPSEMRKPIGARQRRRRAAVYGVDTAGRWAVLSPAGPRAADDGSRPMTTAATAGDAAPVSTRRPLARDAARPRRSSAEHVELFARTLLRRYGVVFRRILARETNAPPWRELAGVYRRLEARGEIRGGRFVAGMTGEQFALPEAVPLLRAVRKEERAGRLIALSAADPLNLTGITTPGERVSALAGNRVLYRDGVPIAAVEKRAIRTFAPGDLDERTIRVALTRRPVDPALRPYLKGFGARGAAPTASQETPRASA